MTAEPRKRRSAVKRIPVRTASPTLRAIFEHMTETNQTLDRIAERLGTHQARLSEYRRGRVTPGLMTVEEMAAAVGLDIIVRSVVKNTTID